MNIKKHWATYLPSMNSQSIIGQEVYEYNSKANDYNNLLLKLEKLEKELAEKDSEILSIALQDWSRSEILHAREKAAGI
jgi:uncharacterized membrane protein YgaE (UPF0421/DUF939 family)